MEIFEKVNPCHPDKVADRIAGAIVDLAYSKQENPKIAVELTLGHEVCCIIAESSVIIKPGEIKKIVNRIAPEIKKFLIRFVPQDEILSKNQEGRIRCGDNGYFIGLPTKNYQQSLTDLTHALYSLTRSDGKLLWGEDGKITVCQSNLDADVIKSAVYVPDIVINPLGSWTGGTGVDAGAVNRKLGSDLGDAVRGAGLHGKDLSKADVTLNILAHLFAEKYKAKITIACSIGDEDVTVIIKEPSGNSRVTLTFEEAVNIAHSYIKNLGGFEKFAEWGLIRPTQEKAV